MGLFFRLLWEGAVEGNWGQDLKVRTKRFALEIIRLFAKLPQSAEGQVLGRQLLRSGTSVGAQYREAIRGKSAPDFISKVQGSLQELEESAYWLDLLVESGIGRADFVSPLIKECDELIAIFVATTKHAKQQISRS